MRAFGWLATGLSGIALLAGCLSGDGGDETGSAVPVEDYGPGFHPAAFDAHGFPVPVPLCLAPLAEGEGDGASGGPDGRRCDFELTPDEGRQGNEVTMAVNPTDPKNVVGGAKDYYPTDAGECVWDAVYVTHDGFATVTEDRSFDGSPWRLLNDPGSFTPNYASQFWCTTDPVAYFDVHGRFYYVLMAYQADPVTGGKTCEGVCPPLPNTRGGALNDWAYNRATQIVAISDDGGDTFHTFTPVLEGVYPVAFHDKAWLAASSDGTIHILWTAATAALVPLNIYCRSTDEGQRFLCDRILSADPTDVGGPNGGLGSFLEVGTGPEVYALWDSAGRIAFRRSMDTGATWEPGAIVLTRNIAVMPGLSVDGFSRDERQGDASLATDRNPDSPFADAVYAVFDDSCQEPEWSQGCRSGGSATWVTASFDKGETWQAPVKVSGPSEDWDWTVFPTIAVSPGGVVDVSWMSTVGTGNTTDEENGEYEKLTQMYVYSLDGGRTWSEPFEIRDAADGGWDPGFCHHQNGMVFIGDYNDIGSSWQAAHPGWPDTRHAVCDVYTATVRRPMFAEGWDDAKRAAAEAFILAHPLV
ncbi:MAG TPA: sialidase family protein [Candidatus Thermoplasmatota archaeon]|nr:sialidase family protein [Candidatus Thermoplasmatota archaeon]